MGTLLAWGQPLLSALPPVPCTGPPAPLLWPEMLVQPGQEHGTRCCAHGPAAGQEGWVPWGNGTRAAWHRHWGVRQSWRRAAQPGHGASIQARDGNLPSARLARLSLAGCPLSLARGPSTGSTGGPRGHPAILPGSARQLEGSAAGERPGREMQQSRAGKERDAGGGGGTPAPAPLAVATATPAVCLGQRGLERGVWGQRWAQARCHPCPRTPLREAMEAAPPGAGWDDGGSELEPLLSPHRPSAVTATTALGTRGTPRWSCTAPGHGGHHTSPARHKGPHTSPAWHRGRCANPALQ